MNSKKIALVTGGAGFIGSHLCEALFNSGNYVLNKDTYINALKKPYEDKSTPLLDADTAAAFYFLLEYGVKFKIIKNFSHHHRLRKDSTWNTCGENSQLSVNYYQNLSIEL